MATKEYTVKVNGDLREFNSQMDAAGAKMEALNDNEVIVSLDIAEGDEAKVRAAVQAMLNMDPTLHIQLTYDLDQRRLAKAKEELKELQDLADIWHGQNTSISQSDYIKKEAAEIQEALKHGATVKSVSDRYKNLLSFANGFRDDLSEEVIGMLNEIPNIVAKRSKKGSRGALGDMFDKFEAGELKGDFGADLNNRIQESVQTIQVFQRELARLESKGATATGPVKGIGEATRSFERLLDIASTLSKIEIPALESDASNEKKAEELHRLATEFRATGEEIKRLEEMDDGSAEMEDRIGLLKKYQLEALKAYEKILPKDEQARFDFQSEYLDENFGDWEIENYIGEVNKQARNQFMAEAKKYQTKIGKELNKYQILDEYGHSTGRYKDEFNEIALNYMRKGKQQFLYDTELADIMERIHSSKINPSQFDDDASESAAEAENKEADANKEAADAAKEKADADKQKAEAEKEASESAKESSESAKKEADANKEAAESAKEKADASKQEADANKEAAESAKEKAEADEEAANAAKEKAESAKESERAADTESTKSSEQTQQPLGDEAQSFQDIATQANAAADAKIQFAVANQLVADVAREAAEQINAEADAMDRISGSAAGAANANKKFSDSGSENTSIGNGNIQDIEDGGVDPKALKKQLGRQLAGLLSRTGSDYGLNAQYHERLMNIAAWIKSSGDDIAELSKVKAQLNKISKDISTRAYDESSQGNFTSTYEDLRARFLELADEIQGVPELESVFGDTVERIRESFSTVNSIKGLGDLKNSVQKLGDDVTSYQWSGDIKKRKEEVLLQYREFATQIFNNDDLKDFGDRANEIFDSFSSVDSFKGLVALQKKIGTLKKDTQKYLQQLDDQRHDPKLNERFLNAIDRTSDLGARLDGDENLKASFSGAYERLLRKAQDVKETNESIEQYESDLSNLENRIASGVQRKNDLTSEIEKLQGQVSSDPGLQKHFGKRIEDLANRVKNISLLSKPLTKAENVLKTLQDDIAGKSEFIDRRTALQNTLAKIKKDNLEGTDSIGDDLRDVFSKEQERLERRLENVSLTKTALDDTENVINTYLGKINSRKLMLNRRHNLISGFNGAIQETQDNPFLGGFHDVLDEQLDKFYRSKKTDDQNDKFELIFDDIRRKMDLWKSFGELSESISSDYRLSNNFAGDLNTIKAKLTEMGFGLMDGDFEEEWSNYLEVQQLLSDLQTNVSASLGYDPNKQDSFNSIKQKLKAEIDTLKEQIETIPELSDYLSKIYKADDDLSKANNFGALGNIQDRVNSLKKKTEPYNNVSVEDANGLIGNIDQVLADNPFATDATVGSLTNLREQLSNLVSDAEKANEAFIAMNHITFGNLTGQFSNLKKDAEDATQMAERLAKEEEDAAKAAEKNADAESKASQEQEERMAKQWMNNRTAEARDIVKQYAGLKSDRGRFFESVSKDGTLNTNFVKNYIDRIQQAEGAAQRLRDALGEDAEQVKTVEAAMKSFNEETAYGIRKRAENLGQKINNAEAKNKQKGTGFDQNTTNNLKAALDDIERIKSIADSIEPGKPIDVESIRTALNLLPQVEKTVNDNLTSKNTFVQKSKIDGLLRKVNSDISSYALQGDIKQQYLELQAALQRVSDEAKNAKDNITSMTEEDFSKLLGQFNELSAKMKAAGMDQPKFLNQFKSAITNQSAQFLATYFSLQDFVRYGREMAQTITAIDSGMTELRKVSGETDARLSESFKTSAETAKDLGANITDIIKSTSDWSRLGYSIGDAEDLARITQIYQNVGDNLTQETASEYLVSTLQGFQINAEDALSVVDKFNEVANNYAIDTQGIGEALERSAASFNASGTSLDKSIALVTATAEVTQDPASAGTVWKTSSHCLNVQKCA